MRAVAPAMGEHIRVVATGFLQRVGQDWQAAERAIGVDAVGEREDRGRAPARIDGDGAEGIAEDVSDELGLVDLLFEEPLEVVSITANYSFIFLIY
jgi:hypothetical protein